MERREFITVLCGAAAWPHAARAQSAGMLRVGMVAAQPRSSPPYEAFLQRLAELGYQQAGTSHSSSSRRRTPKTTLKAIGNSFCAASAS